MVIRAFADMASGDPDHAATAVPTTGYRPIQVAGRLTFQRAPNAHGRLVQEVSQWRVIPRRCGQRRPGRKRERLDLDSYGSLVGRFTRSRLFHSGVF